MNTYLPLAFLCIEPLCGAQTYQVADLGLLGGAPTYASVLNDSGVVCGYAQIDANTTKAWGTSTLNTALLTLPDLGGPDNLALAISASVSRVVTVWPAGTDLIPPATIGVSGQFFRVLATPAAAP